MGEIKASMAMKLGDKATSDVLQLISIPSFFRQKSWNSLSDSGHLNFEEWQPSQLSGQPFCKGFNTRKYHIN